MSFFLPQIFGGFPVTDFRPFRTAAQRRLFQSMLSHWVDSLNSGDEGCGDVFVTMCPLWRMLSSHFQLSLVADLARWCLCEGEPVPTSLSLFHKAALWALHFNFAGALCCEIDTDAPFSPPDPAPPVERQPDGAAASWEASVTWNKGEVLRESAALVAAQGGDLAACGLDILPHAAERGGGAASGVGRTTRRPNFLSVVRRALPAPRDAPPPAVVLPSHHNRLRRLLLEAWQAWGGAGGLLPLGYPAEDFTVPGGGLLRRLAITAEGMGKDEMRALLPLVTTRAAVGLFDSDERLLIGPLKEHDIQRIRMVLSLAERANEEYEAAWSADKARTARDYTVVSLLSRTGSLWGSDVDPETEWEGDQARDPEGGGELRPCNARTEAAEHREATRSFARLYAEGEAEPHASDCRDGVADPRGGHPDGGPTEMDRAAFASGPLGEPLAWGCTPRISERREVRMVGEFHAAMEALYGGAGAAALEAAYDSPQLRLTAIRAISHPAAPVWLDFTSPLEDRRAFQQRRAEERLACDHCSAVCDAGALHTCSGCRVARYCGRACQKRAWPTHKPVCLAIRSAPVEASS